MNYKVIIDRLLSIRPMRDDKRIAIYLYPATGPTGKNDKLEGHSAPEGTWWIVHPEWGNFCGASIEGCLEDLINKMIDEETNTIANLCDDLQEREDRLSALRSLILSEEEFRSEIQADLDGLDQEVSPL